MSTISCMVRSHAGSCAAEAVGRRVWYGAFLASWESTWNARQLRKPGTPGWSIPPLQLRCNSIIFLGCLSFYLQPQCHADAAWCNPHEMRHTLYSPKCLLFCQCSWIVGISCKISLQNANMTLKYGCQPWMCHSFPHMKKIILFPLYFL